MEGMRIITARVEMVTSEGDEGVPEMLEKLGEILVRYPEIHGGIVSYDVRMK